MKIYDISQEVFTSKVYPGDKSPKIDEDMRISNGDEYNLTSFSMCAHNGTHVDAPFHYFENGKTIDQIDLEKFIGNAYLVEHDGLISKDDALNILIKAKKIDNDCYKRILIKGNAELTLEAAQIFSNEEIFLFGNESQTVGSEMSEDSIHQCLLNAEIAILEGLVLSDVKEGMYLLNAAPINLSGSDGAPCRAVLIK